MIIHLVLLAVAGALGTLCRYGLGVFCHYLFGPDFLWGTWLVNTLGCFGFGAVWVASEKLGAGTAVVRLIVLTGFMGAFTTFSTFMFEGVAFMREGSVLSSVLYIAGQSATGFAALLAGIALARIAADHLLS